MNCQGPVLQRRIHGIAVSLLSCILVAVSGFELLPEYNLCNPEAHVYNPATVYLEGPDDIGPALRGATGQSTTVFVNWTWIGYDPSRTARCLMLFKTCPGCQIQVVSVSEEFSYRACGREPTKFEYDNADSCSSECVYIKLLDSDYKSQTLKRVTSSASIKMYPPYTSQSSKLHVVACGRGLDKIRGNVTMRLTLTSVAKYREIKGYVGVSTISAQTMMSPFFPNPYMQNSEKYTYDISAVEGSFADVIVITFDDWSMSPYSQIEISSINDPSLSTTSYSGSSARPYIVVKSKAVRMTFLTGPQLVPGGYNSFLGFKAVATFYRGVEDVPRFVTDCDNTIANTQGGMIIPGRFADARARDCIWVIQPMTGYAGVYMRVLRYTHGWNSWSSEFSENSLEVRAGLTSEAPERMHVTPTVSYQPEYEEQISPNGFYIRLRGIYADSQPLIVAFSQFSFDCGSRMKDFFKCGNGRCISESLRCDMYNHCGDNSDEHFCDGIPDNSVTNNESGHNYNYSISIGVIIPMVVAVALIIIICLLVIFFRRCRRMNRPGNGGGGGGGLLGGRGGQADAGRSRRRDRRRRHRSNRPSQLGLPPSSYGDFPPSYDEALHSTPVEMLNMAFPWSHPDFGFGQPPSYEDAMNEATAEVGAGSPASPPYSSSTDLTNIGSDSSRDGGRGNANTAESRSGSLLCIATTSTSGAYPGLHARLPGGMTTTGAASDANLGQRRVSSQTSAQTPDLTLDPTLDPGAYVSSSSSSEASEAEMRLDVSSSSDSSTDNEQGFIPRATSRSVQAPQRAEQSSQGRSHASRRSSSLSSVGGTPGNSNQEDGKVFGGEREEPVVVKDQDAPNKKRKDLSKNMEGKGSQSQHDNDESGQTGNEHINDSAPNRNERNDRRNNASSAAVNASGQNNGEPSDEIRTGEARGRQRPHLSEERKRGGRKRRGRRHSRNSDLNEERVSSSEQRGRHHDTPSNGGDVSIGSARGVRHRPSPEGEAQREPVARNQTHNDSPAEESSSFSVGLDARKPSHKVNDPIRSQSCFNLNTGGGGSHFPNEDLDVDKRFSYAGAGDVNLGGRRQVHNPWSVGRGLVRDRRVDGLDKFGSSESGNLRGPRETENAQRSQHVSRDSDWGCVSEADEDMQRGKHLNMDEDRPHFGHTRDQRGSLGELPRSSAIDGSSVVQPNHRHKNPVGVVKHDAYSSQLSLGSSSNGLNISNDSRSVSDVSAFSTGAMPSPNERRPEIKGASGSSSLQAPSVPNRPFSKEATATYCPDPPLQEAISSRESKSSRQDAAIRHSPQNLQARPISDNTAKDFAIRHLPDEAHGHNEPNSSCDQSYRLPNNQLPVRRTSAEQPPSAVFSTPYQSNNQVKNPKISSQSSDYARRPVPPSQQRAAPYQNTLSQSSRPSQDNRSYMLSPSNPHQNPHPKGESVPNVHSNSLPRGSRNHLLPATEDNAFEDIPITAAESSTEVPSSSLQPSHEAGRKTASLPVPKNQGAPRPRMKETPSHNQSTYPSRDPRSRNGTDNAEQRQRGNSEAETTARGPPQTDILDYHISHHLQARPGYAVQTPSRDAPNPAFDRHQKSLSAAGRQDQAARMESARDADKRRPVPSASTPVGKSVPAANLQQHYRTNHQNRDQTGPPRQGASLSMPSVTNHHSQRPRPEGSRERHRPRGDLSSRTSNAEAAQPGLGATGVQRPGPRLDRQDMREGCQPQPEPRAPAKSGKGESRGTERGATMRSQRGSVSESDGVPSNYVLLPSESVDIYV